MKVLVATHETQGKRKNDFCFVPDDELVCFGSECDGEPVDGNCGCRRSMVGLECRRATTTVKVVGMDLTKEQFIQKLTESFTKAGYGGIDNFEDFVKEEAEELLRMADYFPVGAILEKRGTVFRVRQLSVGNKQATVKN